MENNELVLPTEEYSIMYVTPITSNIDLRHFGLVCENVPSTSWHFSTNSTSL